ncbi:MAG TPA: hypothetical protein VM223_28390 [Planctomycetota bacterium]|nr:hypothetical protein [Planctomycetota bacterium]
MDSESGRHLCMNFDYFDMTCSAGARENSLYGPERMRRHFRRCADAGFTRIFFRVSAFGTVVYPSKVATPFSRDFRVRCMWLKRNMDAFDPLAAAIEEAHAAGLKIYAWVTLFDSYMHWLDDGYFRNNPDCYMLSRGQDLYFPVPCYAVEKTRAYRLREAEELLDYGIDGIFYSVHSHSGTVAKVYPWDALGPLSIGFNPPVVHRYRDKHGVDILHEPPDAAKLRDVHAEFFNLFLRYVRGTAAVRNCKLICTSDSCKYWDYPPNHGYVEVGMDWPAWLREGVVNEACLIRWSIDDDRIFHEDADLSRLISWIWIHGGESQLPRVRRHVDFCRDHGIGGITFHEAEVFEFDCPEYWRVAESFLK